MLRLTLAVLVGYTAYIFFSLPEEIYFDTDDFIRKAEYPHQRYEVETEDGYRLSLHRIGNPAGVEYSPGRPVVLMMTGLGCASDSWFFRGKNESLPFLLVNRGYDVWLGDYRGSHYSKTHREYHITDTRFFNYSYHEIGLYDTPAMIDFILEKTEQKNVTYIGYSMGTTMFFTMMSMKPEYNSKVNKMIAMAPALYGEDVPEESLKISRWLSDHSPTLLPFRIFERGIIRSSFFALFCGNILTGRFCGNFLHVLGGYYIEDDESMAALIISHVPSAPIPGQLSHFLKNTETGKNQMWNYGPEGNLQRYGSTEPPEYNLSKVSVPVVLLYGREDILVTPKHVATISKLLPNVIEVKACDEKNIGHFDYIWGKMGFSDVLRHLPGS